ncbi:MAG: hypothetical protein HY520_02130, partial [Candidatus Aenigmarchaeota archaeon]|nr:hypothetical protein [Candidatus Aenigmarchaeota archaeon]
MEMKGGGQVSKFIGRLGNEVEVTRPRNRLNIWTIKIWTIPSKRIDICVKESDVNNEKNKLKSGFWGIGKDEIGMLDIESKKEGYNWFLVLLLSEDEGYVLSGKELQKTKIL